MADKKNRISSEIVESLKKICNRRTGGKSSVDAIRKDLISFIKTDLIGKLPLQDKENVGTATDPNRLRGIYSSYIKHMGSLTSMKNAFGDEGVSENRFSSLIEIINLYIDHFEYLIKFPRIDENKDSRIAPSIPESRFSKGVEEKIGDLVNWICSFPKCMGLTRTATLDSYETLIVLGRACMIYGPTEGTPRYDPKIEIELYGTSNGIWLCSQHADAVSGQGWVDFPADKLLEWQRTHRTFVYEKVMGIKSVTGFGFNFESDGSQVATKLLKYISDQEFLLMDTGTRPVEYFTTAVNGFSNYLQEEMLDLKYPVFIARQVSGIIRVCDAFADIVQNPTPLQVFEDGWLIFRKVIGNSLDTIANKYKVQMPVQLRLITPILAKVT